LSDTICRKVSYFPYIFLQIAITNAYKFTIIINPRESDIPKCIPINTVEPQESNRLVTKSDCPSLGRREGGRFCRGC